MALPNIFDAQTSNELADRINKLANNSTPKWGKMNVAQMLAHCNVTYEMAFENQHPKPSGFKKWMLKAFVKPIVVNEKPYKHNSRTAPEFLVPAAQDFATQKSRLLNYMQKTVELGETHFDGKESHSFGALTSKEWSNMFYKHLDHHLGQFGV